LLVFFDTWPQSAVGDSGFESYNPRHVFSSDMLGTNTGQYPRPARRYADVASGAYPEEKRQVDMDDPAFEHFVKLSNKI
jgi:3-methyl-2-oxobutanoate hydroxymethyltransferase